MTNEQNVMFRAVHDVFGHAANGYEFGPRGELNAAASHFQMYGADARGPLLTETHGQTAYVNYSNDLYVPKATGSTPLDAANPVADFEKRYPYEMPARQAKAAKEFDMPMEAEVTIADDLGQRLDYAYTNRVGAGISKLTPEQQKAILQPLADLHDQFPSLRVFHIDAVPFGDPLSSPDTDVIFGLGQKNGAYAVTFGADHNESVVFFNTEHLGAPEEWAYQQRFNEAAKSYDTFFGLDPKTGKVTDMPRQSRFGVPHNVEDTGAGLTVSSVARHEAGHAFDVARRPHIPVTNPDGSRALAADGSPIWKNVPLGPHQAYGDMIARMEKSAGRLDLSEYGFKTSAEFAAELFAYSTDPALIVKNIQSQPLRDMVEEFQKFLTDSGEWLRPDQNELANAGKRIRDINAAKRGTVYAPQKAGLMSQATIDEFARKFVGQGKHVESDPDVARTAQMFGKWSDAAVQNGLLRGDAGIHSGILNDIAGIPTHSASPYNLTEGLAQQLANATMARKWQDAFRLQYFAQNRTMLERSINHPMFGLYPASYMWGKLMPEIVQFIAQRPFGIRTGGAAYSLMDTQAAISMQREYNPAFDAHIEKLGHSQALSMLGFMLPTLPWDVSASAPTWMKDVANQGQRNKAAVEAGTPTEGINVTQPLTDVVSRLNPLGTTIPWAGRAVDEVNGTNTPTEQRNALVDDPTKASDLSPELALIMDELKAALTR